MTMTKFSRINKQREEITMRVLEDMEKGGNEWKKPWVEASPLPPHNPVSGTQYSGRNFLYTYVYGMMRGYADPRWATEKQIKEMGWKIPENLQNGRDVAQRMQTERTTVNQIREEDTVGE